MLSESGNTCAEVPRHIHLTGNGAQASREPRGAAGHGSHGTPIWAFSATMTPSVLQEVEAKLHINPYTSFHINLGNDRPNIAYKVVEVENSQDFASLLDVLQIGQVGSPEDIPKTLIFADTRNMVQRIWRYLREQLGETYHGVIDFLHAYRRQRGRQHAMKRFETGGIRILVATEVIMIGC